MFFSIVFFNTVTGFPVWASIISIGIVCTFYTTIVSVLSPFLFHFPLDGDFPMNSVIHTLNDWDLEHKVLILRWMCLPWPVTLVKRIGSWDGEYNHTLIITRLSGKSVHHVLTWVSCGFSGRYEGCYLEWCVPSHCYAWRSSCNTDCWHTQSWWVWKCVWSSWERPTTQVYWVSWNKVPWIYSISIWGLPLPGW